MSIKHLLAAAAFAPLCFAADAALAQTAITSANQGPIVSGNTPGASDIDISSTGSVSMSVPGPAVTLNGDGILTVEGAIFADDQSDSTDALISTDPSGRAGGFTMTGAAAIEARSTAAQVDTDHDGIADGPFAEPALRYGVRVAGSGVLTGNILIESGSIYVQGTGNTTAVAIDAPLLGVVQNLGNLSSYGTGTHAFRSTAPITGTVELGGGIRSQGEGASAVSIEAPISGLLRLEGTISSTGFRTDTRPTNDIIAKLSAEDLLIGGPTVQVASSIAGGVWLYTAPAVTLASDGTVDTTADTDADGVPDYLQTSSGSITQAGSAPGLLIGGSSPLVLGNVGTIASRSYGVLLDGAISATGVYDNITANAIQIGGQGGTVDTGGGVRIAGSVAANAAFANATGLRLEAGATVPSLVVDGSVSAAASGDATRAPSLKAVQIDAGASLPSLVNTGVLAVAVSGPSGSAVAVADYSGTLVSITQQGQVVAGINSGNPAAPAVGDVLAFDLRANTAGVTLTQNVGATGFTPAIAGDILFGSGNANLDVEAGVVNGAVAFGTGTNVLTVGSGASVTSNLTNGGSLATTVNGNLFVTHSSPIQMTSLTTGAGSALSLAINPADGTASTLQVSGTATLAANSNLGMSFVSKLTSSSATNYSLINAAGGLVNNGVVTTLAGSAPFLYQVTPTLTANNLSVSVRQRTTAELGLQGAKANAFNAFYAAFDKDAAVAGLVLAKNNQADFNTLYNQFLPDYSGGPFNSLATGVREVMRVQAEAPVDMDDSQPRSWLQEVGFGVDHASTTNQVAYETAGFAVAGGYERPVGDLGVIGYSATILTSDVRDDNRAFGSTLGATSMLGSLYWRKAIDGLVLDAAAMGGYARVSSNRRIVDESAAGLQNLIRTADAGWSGGMAGARIGAAYEARMGPFYVRPEALIDYIYLNEAGYTERGGGPAINLTVDGRQSSSAEGELGIAFGGRFGQGFHWGPELSIAYRANLAGNPGATTAAFTSLPGNSFSLPALAIDRHRLLVRLALRGSGSFANFSLEGTGEFGDLVDAYTGRLVVRFLF